MVSGLDAVDVATDHGADHAGEHLCVADVEVCPAAVVVVLSGTGEVGQQNPAAVLAGALLLRDGLGSGEGTVPVPPDVQAVVAAVSMCPGHAGGRPAKGGPPADAR